ncbi:MCP methyltransferase, CheR-type [Desulfamplus magnetovallimortis]|uniref:protein-glutamate O-methyltransferase n=1 Tax=Desulfamplus magnetovallimortis TaxID=1246637 RepID=A0A1W1HC47_9BACT|nr:protein-glutamate O-methyltransferase CheR [Desulfamplus magnetovallimortis]SLM30067.1 MCP methyltransferase, CheR-type [Desulfamplus magnetovallimortis]
MSIKVTPAEYAHLQKYIEDQCGILLEKGKEYLIESRLTDLALENRCSSFTELLAKARSDYSGKLKDRIVDAMTTNETLWFRDHSAWEYIREVAVPSLLDKAESGERVRVWSAAASTGQEAYSLLMLFNDEVIARRKPHLLNQVEIIGTDISTSALSSAINARYGAMAVKRGMSEEKKRTYFTRNGDNWDFDQKLKTKVTFKHFNLQNSFISLGLFDLILCRYVAIYFSDPFKRELFSKMARALKPGSVLILGATESLRGFSQDFNIIYYKDAVINEKPL